jgi:hypothetical protein
VSTNSSTSSDSSMPLLMVVMLDMTKLKSSCLFCLLAPGGVAVSMERDRRLPASYGDRGPGAFREGFIAEEAKLAPTH